MRVAALLLFPVVAVTQMAAAQNDVLTVERRSDLLAHAAAKAMLQKARMPVRAVDMSAKELCSMLSMATANKLSFACSGRDSDAAPKLNLDLHAASLWSIMSMAQMETGLRFVYRAGIVFFVKAEEVKPFTYLAIYDLRGACAPLRSFPGPDLRLRTAGDDRPLFPEEVESGGTVSGLTAEDIESLLRDTVRPDSWAAEGVSLSNQNGLFLIRQSPQVQREIHALLVRLGVVAPPRLLPARRYVRPGGLRISPARRAFGRVRW